MEGEKDELLAKIARLEARLAANDAIVKKYIARQKEQQELLREQNNALEQKQAEILAQNEELIQSQEELNTQREFIEQQNRELSQTNQKLLAHEQILKKALQKLKDSEEQIKQQNNALEQKQGEILAQNEELIQSQEELQTQWNFIENQTQLLKEQYEKLNTSLRAAQHIQQSILPSQEKLTHLLKEWFVIYTPKDIVSGDLYFVEQVEDKLFLACIDCTGHGVEGAFVTLITHGILSLLLKEKKLTSPAMILEHLDKEFRIRLNQEKNRFYYGMDIALLCIERNSDGCNVVFSGAKSEVYFFADHQIQVLKGKPKSIGGIYNPNKEFFNQTISVSPGTVFYLSTDGFFDVVNAQGKKPGKNGFIEWLKQISQQPFETQKECLLKLSGEFCQNPYQRDDILVMGFKV